MVRQQHWRLPEGVDELLPPAAWQLEMTRRRVLDVFRSWGFEYVDPPVIEYLDALLVGSGSDMDLQTLKVVDQRSGRLLGVRADMTSQAARIDAHSLPADGVQRLCYSGSVVHANPTAVLDTRVPLKAGAEIFGTQSPAADAEVIALLLDVLHTVGITAPVLVLGHVGIYNELVGALDLPAEQERTLFSAVQRKSATDIAELLGSAPGAERVARLPALMGRRDVLDEARRVLAVDAAAGSAKSQAEAALAGAIDSLEHLADLVAERCPDVELRFDLAELAGYGYHNGPVFSAYQAGSGSAVARGGRYDGIGAAFGRARPATGFDVSLKQLPLQVENTEPAVWAPWIDGEPARRQALQACLQRLRAEGEIVLAALSASDRPPARCNRILTEADGNWTVRPLKQEQF
ncbi:MAG: ATP phosphoribosyltransferase regulatory subunit [Gammaproteobacteria bacterium]|nr:ATP phosphoribosyltransferase regulatory subunit [Gammaproteobacteria bacterium]